MFFGEKIEERGLLLKKSTDSIDCTFRPLGFKQSNGALLLTADGGLYYSALSSDAEAVWADFKCF